jgi:hypothetical protein
MKRGLLINIALLAAVIILGLLAWRTPSREEAARTRVRGKPGCALRALRPEIRHHLERRGNNGRSALERRAPTPRSCAC